MVDASALTSLDLGSLEFIQPLIARLRESAVVHQAAPVGAYAFALHPLGQEIYLFGFDAADREFAFRFSPDQFDSFVQAGHKVAQMGADRRGPPGWRLSG